MPNYFSGVLSVLELIASQLQGAWQPPREHLILVGGPSNMYNGFGRFVGGEFQLNPAPASVGNADMDAFLLGSETHDRYWANFLEPIPRLFTQNIAAPAPGDIVTVLVYAPPYYYREDVDWEASPWNTQLWQDSPWVLGHDPYDPFVRHLDQNVVQPPQPPTVSGLVAPTPPPPPRPPSEARLNHEILMRATGEPKPGEAGYPKRPTTANHWREILHNLPRRILFGPTHGGAPRYPSLLVKLLLATEVDQILYYIATGQWEGRQWVHAFDTYDEQDAATVYRPNWIWPYEPLFDFVGSLPTPGAALDWNALPAVNRERVKIARLDYFGHSGEGDPGTNELYLQYGWENAKGDSEGIGGEIGITTDDLITAIEMAGSPPFAPDAVAQLWGCSLGESMAQALTAHVKTVIATPELTEYDHILPSETTMPVPANGQPWTTYTAPP